MKQQIKPLTESEKDRLIEIDFYLFVKHLLNKYNNSILALDIIEALGQLYNCNITALKQLALGIYNKTSLLIPSKQELIVLLYKEGNTLNRLRSKLNIHPQTVYRMLGQYINEGQFEYVSKLNDEGLIIVKSFMTQLHDLIDWR